MNKYCSIFCALVTCVFILIYLYSNSSIKHLYHHQYGYNYTYINNNSSTKVILYWDTFHGDKTMGLGLGSDIFSNCAVNNCLTTDNKKLMPVEYFNAVLFHGARFQIKANRLPNKRSINQKYIFFSWESAYNTYLDPGTIYNFYNWTMTFKRNSDILYPYGIVVKQNTSYVLPSDDFVSRKKKRVAWFASNCYTDGGKQRKAYVQRLAKHIPIDTYGDCGKLKCPHSKECYKMIEATYKFYLSFENSFCPDYVTEKLFNVLRFNIIPIVWSGANYTPIVPEKSVINAREYKDEKELAEFLLELDVNNTKYLEYFEWKKDFVVKNGQEFSLCQICKKLNEPLQYSNYENMKNWYYDQCTTVMN